MALPISKWCNNAKPNVLDVESQDPEMTQSWLLDFFLSPRVAECVEFLKKYKAASIPVAAVATGFPRWGKLVWVQNFGIGLTKR